MATDPQNPWLKYAVPTQPEPPAVPAPPTPAAQDTPWAKYAAPQAAQPAPRQLAAPVATDTPWAKYAAPEPEQPGLGQQVARGLFQAGPFAALGATPTLRQFGRGVGEAGLSAIQGAANLLGLERGAEAAETLRETGREVLGTPETTPQRVAAGAGRLTGEAALFAAPGAAATRIPAVQKLRGVSRLAAQAGIDAPVDALLGAASRDESIAGALANLTGNETLEEIAQDTKKRAAFEVVAGAGATGAVVGGLRTLGRALPARAPEPPKIADDPDVRQVIESVSRGEKDTFAKKISRAAQGGFDKVVTRLIDETLPLHRFEAELTGTRRLQDVRRTGRLSAEIARARGWKGSADVRLDEDFRKVVQAAEGKEDEVVALAKAERALELENAGLEKTDILRETLEATRQKLSAIPEVRQSADALRSYYRELLDYKLRNGVITPEQFEQITASGQFYIPFVRDFGVEPRPPTAGGGRLVPRGTGVRRMGEEQARAATVDPFEQAVLDTYETHRTVAKQRVTNIVADMVEQQPDVASRFMRRLEPGETARTGREVQANVRGQRQRYEVTDEELFNAWAAFDPYTGGIFTKFVGGPAKRLLRAGVTAMPDFGLANAIRDNLFVAVQTARPGQLAAGAAAGAAVGAGVSEENRLRGAAMGALLGVGAGGVLPQVARTLDAMGDILAASGRGQPGGGLAQFLGDPEQFLNFLREGGSGFGFFVRNRGDATRVISDLKQSGVDAADIVSPRKWWGAFQAMNRAIEQAPRLARFKQLQRGGLPDAAAAAGARDISLDFARVGSGMKWLSANTAFMNAQVQGWDKLTRMLRDPKTWGAAAATITAPTVALWTLNSQNPEYWARPQWERNLFWLVPKEGGGFLRIPKPFEVGFIFASLPERILDYMAQKDPETTKFALLDMLRTYGPGANAPIPTVFEPLLENLTNFDLFRNRPVVPIGEQRLPEELQFGPETSTVSVKVGDIINASPRKVENVIRGLTGSTGSLVLDATSSFARKLGLDPRPAPAGGQRPFIGRFTTRPDVQSDQEAAIWRRWRAAEQARNGFRKVTEQGDLNAAQRYVQENREALQAYQTLKPVVDGLREVNKVRDQIEENRELSREQKREAMAKLNSALAKVLGGQAVQPGQLPVSIF